MTVKKLCASLFLAFLFGFAATAPYAANSGGAIIRKCQGEDGNWHYGDTAAAECSKSKVIEITDQGYKSKVIDAPATAQELTARKAAEERHKQEEIRKHKDRVLLSTYAHEDDIVYLRDRKLKTIAGNILASEQTLVPLRAALARMEAQAADEQKSGKPVSKHTADNIARTKGQISRHMAVIEEKKRETEILKQNYDKDLVRYRELKRKQVSR